MERHRLPVVRLHLRRQVVQQVVVAAVQVQAVDQLEAAELQPQVEMVDTVRLVLAAGRARVQLARMGLQVISQELQLIMVAVEVAGHTQLAESL